MSRAPIAGWRRLFAIGGAPAASHAALSRTPSADRLLDPLARASVTGSASFDALLKPLDVGDVLSRVTSAPATERQHENAEGDAVRKHLRQSGPSAVVQEVKSSGAAATLTRKRAAIADTPRATSSRPTRLTPTVADRVFAARTDPEHAPVVSAKRRSLVGAPRDARNRSALPMLAAERLSASKSLLTPEARDGASSRVLLAAAVDGIDRLLDVTQTAVARQGASAARVTPIKATPIKATPIKATPVKATPVKATAAKATPQGAARDVASLLNGAVDRARDAIVPAAVASEPERATGFRGLAQRTLTPARVARSVQTQRIEPEVHVSQDLALDALDSRIADSLGRILEREARRHGLDMTEMLS